MPKHGPLRRETSKIQTVDMQMFRCIYRKQEWIELKIKLRKKLELKICHLELEEK
jgi:hypothetical protein